MPANNSKTQIYLPLLLSLALITGLYAGNFFASRKVAQTKYIVYRGNEKINQVLHYIQSEYVDSISEEQLSEAAIIAMIDSLDPHSVYIPARELTALNEPLEGSFSGIGIQFNMNNDTIVIIKTIANGPSEKTGLLAGDRIIKIEDSIVAGKNLDTDLIMKKLKGKKGTKVKVSIQRGDLPELIDYVIVRDNIPLYSIDVSYMVAPGIGYIKISEFSRKTAEEFRHAVRNLLHKGMQKLILDLRGNGGGYMNAAIEIADEMLPEGKLIVYTQGRRNPRNNFMATRNGMLKNTEIAVLIDEWSASASEIIAGAIQDNDRGKIIGRRSFGKGLVQQQIMLNDGSAIRLTIARYYSPTGRSIQKPYTKNKNDYYSELGSRYEHGEFFEKDSIHLPDSLKYTTPGGNTVYGGGGIMPNIFIPQDTIGVSPYYTKITHKGLIYKFAFTYADKNREKLKTYNDVASLEKYLDTQDLLAQLVDYASRNGVEKNDAEINKSTQIIHTQLKANIARNILDNEGYYPIISRIDRTLQKCIEILK